MLMSLQAIHHFKIAKAFSIDEEITYHELSQRTGLPEDDARRLLRMAVANHVFFEPRKNVIKHTAVSAMLAEDDMADQWLRLVCDEIWPGSSRTVPALLKYPGSQEPNHSGFAINDPEGRTLWEALSSDAEREQAFSDAMHYQQLRPPFRIEFLFDELQWDDETCPAVLVDVGGSQGATATQLLRRFSRIERCVVQDLPGTVQGATAPSDISTRLEFSTHDFFTEQREKDADVYFLRQILHDWPDQYAITILRNLIPALKGGARVIVNEVCMPEPNTIGPYRAQFVYGFDLAMKVINNGKERDVDEWKKLFHTADSRFIFNRISSVPGSILSVVEFIWQP